MILAVALLFSAIGMICGTTILFPDKMEKIVLTSTVAGATVNFLLNLFLIPWLGIYGAAITTLISELLVSLIQLLGARYRIRQVKLDVKHTIIPAVIGVGLIVGINLALRMTTAEYKVNLILSVIMSVAAYTATAMIFHNGIAMKAISMIKKRRK